MSFKGKAIYNPIEPIIDFQDSLDMIEMSWEYCDLYKVGLMSGKKYDVVEAQTFVERLMEIDNKIYLKESLVKLTHYTHEDSDNFVQRDYNLFTDK
jgi:hypothetical protein